MAKISERTFYDLVKATAQDIIFDDVEYAAEDIIAFCDKRVENIEKRNELNRQKTLEKRAKGDELQGVVIKYLSENPDSTITTILKAIDGQVDFEISPQMVSARLRNLVDSGQATRNKVKGLMHFSLV